VLLGAGFVGTGTAVDTQFTVSSPNRRVVATLEYTDAGTLTYRVNSRNREIISPSLIGIDSDRGDFRSGMMLVGNSRAVVDETYTLPQGKVSTYHNRANELVLRFKKNGQEMHVRFRAYDDGVAFSFAIPGHGDIVIHGENSTITLSGKNFTYWGQSHPNSYGYETRLGPVDSVRMSNPVLAHLQDRDHFVLMGQAATYGNYVQCHFERSGSSFRYAFPLDQDSLGPVRTTLPFQSPWRMVIVSPETPGKIVESYMVENLNPPTDPGLLDPDGTVKDWVRPGRVMWDFIAGDRDKPKLWIDAAAQMGWEYYLADAGFADRFGGGDSVRNAAEYAAERGVSVIGWAHTRDFDTYEKAVSTMRRYAEWGLKGAKIDFFDHNTLSDHPRDWRDYEDTQRSLQMRDWIFELGIANQFLLELHGSTIPTGERRRYPHLMTLEAVNGMEKRQPDVTNDLTIPFVRNVMGPVSYTIVRLGKSPGSHAYQMAMSVVYEAGLMIYAEHGDTLLKWPGREMIQDVPTAWDETKFIDGMPGSHVIVARRKGDDWFMGGMTRAARTAKIRLDFLAPGRDYDVLVFRDDTHTTMHRETRTANSRTDLSIAMLENGGFTIRLTALKASTRAPKSGRADSGRSAGRRWRDHRAAQGPPRAG
jgi:alpha-glucosidase